MNTLNLNITIEPSLDTFLEERKFSSYTVFSGNNNNGKTLILKGIRSKMGSSSHLILTNRFYQIHYLSTQNKSKPDEITTIDLNVKSQLQQVDHNQDQNFLDLARVLSHLNDSGRKKLFNLCEILLGSKFNIKRTDRANDLSYRYIDMDGVNLSFGSTGVRLLMTILGICMGYGFSSILIDEPELGLSPRIQKKVALFLQNERERVKYFPEIKQVFVASHSHLFLDRNNIKNNFVVIKKNNIINLKQTKSIIEFHELQFNQLGNDLETLFLPSIIVVVEGKTDYKFIKKCIQLSNPNINVVILSANGPINDKVKSVIDSHGGLNKSPYTSRIFAVLDKTNSNQTNSINKKNISIISKLEKIGLIRNNIIEWNQNGIEYLYPKEILKSIYMCTDGQINHMTVANDKVEINSITYTKSELCDLVIEKMNDFTILDTQIINKLINPIKKLTS